MSLQDQTILITGATGAIGQAMARAVVAEGARVVIHYGRNRDAAEARLADLGGRGWCLPADLSDPQGAWSLWSAAVGVAGRITGLVNNAGMRSEVAVDAPLAEWQAMWEREMRVNFLAAVDLTRSAMQLSEVTSCAFKIKPSSSRVPPGALARRTAPDLAARARRSSSPM